MSSHDFPKEDIHNLEFRDEDLSAHKDLKEKVKKIADGTYMWHSFDDVNREGWYSNVFRAKLSDKNIAAKLFIDDWYVKEYQEMIKLLPHSEFLLKPFARTEGLNPYLLFDWVDGNLSDLIADHISERRLLPNHEDYPFRLELCKQIASGLEALHKVGIKHENLHYRNVLFKIIPPKDPKIREYDYQMLLADCKQHHKEKFWVVKQRTDEYFACNKYPMFSLSDRDDIWSFGIICYQICCLIFHVPEITWSYFPDIYNGTLTSIHVSFGNVFLRPKEKTLLRSCLGYSENRPTSSELLKKIEELL
jgi:serine/threonine protein kinase